MTARTASQIGASNRRAGKAWQAACARWLRDNGWPGAEYQIRNGAADLTGTGDLSVECTLESWERIPGRKFAQAERDARAKDAAWWCVWKKRRGFPDPGAGIVMIPAEGFFSIMRMVEELEADLAAVARVKDIRETAR